MIDLKIEDFSAEEALEAGLVDAVRSEKLPH